MRLHFHDLLGSPFGRGFGSFLRDGARGAQRCGQCPADQNLHTPPARGVT